MAIAEWPVSACPKRICAQLVRWQSPPSDARRSTVWPLLGLEDHSRSRFAQRLLTSPGITPSVSASCRPRPRVDSCVSLYMEVQGQVDRHKWGPTKQSASLIGESSEASTVVDRGNATLSRICSCMLFDSGERGTSPRLTAQPLL